MGELGEFDLKLRIFLKAYRWRRIDPVPWAALRKPLAESKLALVSSAGLVAAGQQPFDRQKKGGDPSYRILADDLELGELVDTHRSESYDHSGVRRDPNLAFPLDRCRELVEMGRIGELNRRHISVMGSITAPGRLVKYSIPEVASLLVEDRVDVSLLVPV